MKIQRGLKPHLLCHKDARWRPDLAHPVLEVHEGKGWIVTIDGNSMAAIPVELDKGDVPGAIPVEGLARACKGRKGDPDPQLLADAEGVTLPAEGLRFLGRPDVKFPDWRAALASRKRKGKPVQVSLNPNLLVQIAKAMGRSGRRSQVTLEIRPDEKGNHDLGPVTVTVHGAPAGSIAILMPMRDQ